jgi:UDP-glucose 4-epimerase
MAVTVIGQSSFMARAVREKAPEDWVFLSHASALASPDWLKSATCVVNFAYNPKMRTGAYDGTADVDSKLAKMIAGEPVHYVMLSSRMVYGRSASGGAMKETDATAPVNPYGSAKLVVERSLHNILGEKRLTILRLSNVFGMEPGRKSFLGMAQASLMRDNRIIYDMSPFVRRDFLSAWRFAEALVAIASSPKPGIYNLGAGFGIETGMIAEWLIEGYGKGELLVNKFSHEDQFWLDMEKTTNTYGIPASTPEELRKDCLHCGRALKAWKNA